MTMTTAARDRRHFRSLGAAIDIRVTNAESDGAYSLIEMTLPPRFPGAPPHYHQHMSERFTVLAGSLEFQLDDERLTLRAGDSVMANAGVVHAFRNVELEEARLLILATPGGHEQFFRELVAWMEVEPLWPPADANHLIAFGRRHDTYYV